MRRIYGGAILAIVGIASFIETAAHRPAPQEPGLRLPPTPGELSPTAYDLLRIGAWAFVILGTDHSSYWEFAPNSIAKKYWFTDAAESYTSPQVETSRQSDDIFVHRLLGLWFLGFGTGDIDIRFSTAGSGQKVFSLKNVWRAAHVEKEINRLVA